MTTKREMDEFERMLAADGFAVRDGDLVCRGIAGEGDIADAGGISNTEEIADAGGVEGARMRAFLSGVLRKSPGNRYALLSRGPYTMAASLLGHGVPPYLDDMAQMIGPRLHVRARGAKPFSMGVNTAVLLRGEGALLAADSPYELHALAMVVEKSCLAAVASPLLGGARAIPFFEALLMRRIYVSKYRKAAGRAKGKTADE